MSALSKKTLWAIGFAAITVVAFAFGRWTGALKESLSHEASYPWALQRKIASINAACKNFQTSPKLGKFIVQSTDDGETLLIATTNDKDKTIYAFAISAAGQIASDSWPSECK